MREVALTPLVPLGLPRGRLVERGVHPALETVKRVARQQRVADPDLQLRTEPGELLVVERGLQAAAKRITGRPQRHRVHLPTVRPLDDERREPVPGDGVDRQQRFPRQLFSTGLAHLEPDLAQDAVEDLPSVERFDQRQIVDAHVKHTE